MPKPTRSRPQTRLGIELLEDRLTPANPLASADAYTITKDQTLTATVTQGVLANDTSAGAPMRAGVFQGPAHGSLSLAADGSFVYTPDPGFAGTDEFYYQVTDTAGGGRTLYTVDAATDQLVALDRDTGNFRIVGDIGYDMYATDIAALNGVIYAVTANHSASNPSGFALVGIDVRTGAKVSVVQLSTGNPDTLADVDGLAVVKGELLIAYIANDLSTSNIGKINLQTGHITLVQGFGGGQDFDGIGANENGILYAVNTEAYSAPLKQIIFQQFTFQPSPNVFNIRDDVLSNAIISDLAFTPFGMYAIDNGERLIHRYNSTTFVREDTFAMGLGAASFIGIDWAADSASIGKVTITVGSVPSTPGVTDVTTNEDTQTGNIVVTRGATDGPDVTHFKVANIQHGTLYKHDGVTVINNGDFITVAEGAAGLRFTPAPNYFGPASFDVQGALSASDAGLVAKLYAIDAATDRLVTIDPTTGAYAPVGPIGFDVSNHADITYFNGALYAATFSGSTWTLLKINPQTGALISSVPITIGSQTGSLIVDGLEAQGGKLLIAFDVSDGTPSAIGEVDPATGSIAPIFDFDSLGYELDFDAIAASETGPLYAIDIRQLSDPQKQILFQQFTFQPSPGVINVRDAVLSNSIILDFALTSSAVYALDTGRRELQLYNRNTFDLETQISLGLGAASFTGLAVVTAPRNSATVTITVNPVADTPSVTGAATNEDTQTASGLVILPNAADGAEVTHFRVTNIQNGTLYKHDGATVINSGDFITVAEGAAGLKFTPTLDLNSDASTFSFRVQAATSATSAGLGGNVVTATVTVTPVNDAPTFTKGADQTVPVNSGSQVVTGWATGFNAGPGNESGQSVLAFEVIGNTNPALFAVAPTIAPDGTLSYTPATGALGSAEITIVVRDDGGISGGGVNQSAPQRFTIAVTQVVVVDPPGNPLPSTPVSPLPARTVIAVGSPLGTPSQARLIDSRTGAELLRVVPFAGFSGGVSVAAGDLNGDGKADLVVGASAGGNTHVRTFDGATGAEIASFLAYRGFNGAVSVAVGDVNGDGFGDIVTGAGSGAPGGHVKAFNVVAHTFGGLSVVSGEAIASFFAYDGAFRGGVSVATGDVNGDGIADIITGSGPGAPNGHVKVFSGPTRAELASFYAFSGFTGGLRVSAADLDGDGAAEVVVLASGTPHVKVFGKDGSTRSSYLAYPRPGYSAFGVTTADVNRDGITEVVTSALTGAAPQLRAFRGAGAAQIEVPFVLPDDILGGIEVG